MTRERVIKDIRNLEDAAKIEETVKTGYCDTITENIEYWIAVEEDIVDSYTRLSKETGPGAAPQIKDLANESVETLDALRRLQKSFETLGQERLTRMQTIKKLRTA